MALEFRDVDAAQMKRVEQVIVEALAPFRAQTEAALAVFALARCMRTLLRLYPETTRQSLTDVVVDFLDGRTAPRDVLKDAGVPLHILRG